MERSFLDFSRDGRDAVRERAREEASRALATETDAAKRVQYREAIARTKCPVSPRVSAVDPVRHDDQDADDDDGWLTGYAAVFNSMSQDLGGFRETIKPGAFDDVLASKPDVIGVVNHDNDALLGRTSAKTLRLWVDNRGLAFSLRAGSSPRLRDIVAHVRRGDFCKCSFSFSGAKDSWSRGSGTPIRTINSFGRLFDVSIVTSPAYADTRVSFMRSDPLIRHYKTQLITMRLRDAMAKDLRSAT